MQTLNPRPLHHESIQQPSSLIPVWPSLLEPHQLPAPNILEHRLVLHRLPIHVGSHAAVRRAQALPPRQVPYALPVRDDAHLWPAVVARLLAQRGHRILKRVQARRMLVSPGGAGAQRLELCKRLEREPGPFEAESPLAPLETPRLDSGGALAQPGDEPDGAVEAVAQDLGRLDRAEEGGAMDHVKVSRGSHLPQHLLGHRLRVLDSLGCDGGVEPAVLVVLVPGVPRHLILPLGVPHDHQLAGGLEGAHHGGGRQVPGGKRVEVVREGWWGEEGWLVGDRD
mmetsp:Transcript_49544/g.123753  ORF Transcript_49544/g.123753 Transcript_49544/m.123753 type:complete len:282 (-) Transcript_49544:105-950(-)